MFDCTGEPGQHERKSIHWEMSKMQRYVHCKLREFCKEASILKGRGTKNKCSFVSKDEPINKGWRIIVK